jgi:hypothetical protein
MPMEFAFATPRNGMFSRAKESIHINIANHYTNSFIVKGYVNQRLGLLFLAGPFLTLKLVKYEKDKQGSSFRICQNQ